MFFHIYNNKLFEKFKSIQTKIKNLQNIKLKALVYNNVKYIKTTIRTYGDKVYTNFFGLNVPEDGVKCESFTIISIDYENKH